MNSLSFVATLHLTAMNAAKAQDTLPSPDPQFMGLVQPRSKDSRASYPAVRTPPAGAPNILVILTDDVGFGASSTFGGPVPTPAFDRLASEGLRYNQFHTTALCSPSRAALLTGRNHHVCGSGVITEGSTGFPGYNALLPRSCATVAEVLRQHGYATAAFGKWHNTPDWEISSAGPFDHWPTQLGFEHFYGFHGGDTNQYAPAVYAGTTPIEPYLGRSNYLLNDDLAEQATQWISQQKAIHPGRPVYVHYAPGGAHAPHHAPRALIEKYQGKFDAGWDEIRQETFERQKRLGVIPAETMLTPRPAEIKAWDSLKPDQRKLFARMMEVYAAFLEHTDATIGQVIEGFRRTGEFDNTLVIYIQGDNGASGEGSPNGSFNEGSFLGGVFEDYRKTLARIDDLGGPLAYNHYPIGWAHAMNTPFQWMKQVASHYGGTRNGMVISWPKRITDRGGLRSQWQHVTDIAPTLYEAAGVTVPSSVNGVAQKPLDGTSLAYSFGAADAPSRHPQQYFEMLGNRAIYHEGWVAATTPRNLPWSPFAKSGDVIDDYQWELYHVENDFSQAQNLAKEHADQLARLQLLFFTDASRFDVLPLDDRRAERIAEHTHPSLLTDRTRFEFPNGTRRIPEAVAPNVKNRSFVVTADLEISQSTAEGVLVTQGGRFGGWGLWLNQGKPVFYYNISGLILNEFASEEPLSLGKHTVAVDVKHDGGRGAGANVTMLVDGKSVAVGRLKQTVAYRFNVDESFDVGADTGTPVAESYQVPFPFEGTIERVTIDLK